MAKLSQSIAVTVPLVNEDDFISGAIPVPKAFQYDIRADLTLDTGTVTGGIDIKVISVDTDDFYPLDGDVRVMEIPVEELSSGGTVKFAKGITSVAGISNVKIAVENNSGVSITAGTIKFGYANGNF